MQTGHYLASLHTWLRGVSMQRFRRSGSGRPPPMLCSRMLRQKRKDKSRTAATLRSQTSHPPWHRVCTPGTFWGSLLKL